MNTLLEKLGKSAGLLAVVAMLFSVQACGSDSDSNNGVPDTDMTEGDSTIDEDIIDQETTDPDTTEPDTTEPDTQEDTVEPMPKTSVRVLHLSPDAPAVDIWVNSTIAAVTDLAFPDGTGYLEIDAGTYTFDIVPAGGVIGDSVLDVTLALEEDMKYTAVAIGELSNLSALALADDYDSLAAGNIRVRAIHAAPAVGEVDIWVIPGEGDPSLLYENVGFGVAGEYADVPAGSYKLGFDVDNDATPDLIFNTPALPAGAVINLFAANDTEGNVFLRAQFADGTLATIEPTPIVEPSETAHIRVLHLSPDAPAVDILVNDTILAVEDLAFPDGTDYLELDVGSYTFDVVPAGGMIAESVLGVTLELMADKKYTAVALGRVADIGALALEDDEAGLEAGKFRVRAIHAAADVGEVDIWVLPEDSDPFILYENVGFGVAGDYADVDAGAYTLAIDVDDDAVPELLFQTPSLPAGEVINLFAVNDADGKVFLRAQFKDGTLATIEGTEYVEPMKKAMLRVIHLSPDAPTVDVWVNEVAAAVTDLAFPNGTSYLDVDEGTYKFDVVPAGGAIGDSVYDVTLDLMGDKSYTAVALGRLASFSALALEDDFANLDAGKFRVRAIHAAADVGEVDIWVIPSEGAPSILYEDVPFGVAGAYLDLDAGSYTLGFDVNNDANPDLIFVTPALMEGEVINLFAVNDADGKVFLRAQFKDGTLATLDPLPPAPAKIRVLHLSPDAPAVDVWVNQAAAAVQGLAFPDGTTYLDVDAGEYRFDVVPSGGLIGESALDVTLNLEAGVSYTAVAVNEVTKLQALALVDDYSGLADGNIRVRAIHAAPAVGDVDIWVIPSEGAPSILYENVPFGAVAEYVDLPSAAYTLGFDVDNDATPDVIFEIPQLPAGTVANVFATNDASHAVFLRAQLNDSSLVTITPSM